MSRWIDENDVQIYLKNELQSYYNAAPLREFYIFQQVFWSHGELAKDL